MKTSTKSALTVLGTAAVFAVMLAFDNGKPAHADTALQSPVETTSIGVITPGWRVSHPPAVIDGVLYTNGTHQWVAALAAGPCAVKIQVTDLVTDNKERCFDFAQWQARGCLGQCVVVPVPRDPEHSIRIGEGGTWIRVPRLREDPSIDWRLGASKRRSVRQ